jgi:hypothetical protein
MPSNTSPIFSKAGDIQWNDSPIVTANTTTDLTTGTSYLIFTADATNGGYIQKLRIRALGTNVATVMRVWINNGSTTGTATNNVLYDEISLASSTVSQTSALAVYELPLNFAMPLGYTIYVTIGTTVVAGFDVTAIAGKY